MKFPRSGVYSDFGIWGGGLASVMSHRWSHWPGVSEKRESGYREIGEAELRDTAIPKAACLHQKGQALQKRHLMFDFVHGNWSSLQ